MELSGRAALVTGGARIGSAVAVGLAKGGADVAVVYRRSRAAAEQTALDVQAAGRRGVVIHADLREPADCARAVADAAAALGRLDVLVNLASIYTAKPFEELSVADWDDQLNVDLRAAWLCARAAIPHMRRAGEGRIINLTDWVAASRRPRYRGFLPYYVAKAGVIALTEGLALEVAADRILVNAIAAGPILAPEGTLPGQIRAVERATPLGRWGGAGEIVAAVLSLVSSDFVTGETVRVDGGRHLS